jgi:ATP-dependent helicase HrpB
MRIALPIDPQLSEIAATVKKTRNVILTATPGAGKTTRLPPELLSSVSGKILVLEPRRMAAVAAAHRVAEERGWRVSEEVGYQVRFDSRVGPKTRLRFVTDALALRMLVDDPELNGVDLVVIDEFHERNLNQDLLLGCLREMQELGRDIKVMIMSATLDTRKLMAFFGDAVLIDVPGKVFPLEIRHSNESLSLRTDHSFFDRVSDAVAFADRETDGDILVFMPGQGEINRTRDRLLERGVRREIDVLHGSLPLKEQQRVLRGGEGVKRVILSTNVAEASVTVDGVDCVIDTGLAKVMQTNFKTGFSSLELSRIALFNARQRAGRAARQNEGLCLRLWTAHEEVTQAEIPLPECARADLSGSLLLLAFLGVSDFNSFAWLDRPPGPLLSLAEKSLVSLGALDKDFRLTDLGRRLIQFPLPPRWGALLAKGEETGAGDLAARMCAVLNERDILPDTKNPPTTQLECDLLLRLEMMDDYAAGRTRGLRGAEQVEAIYNQLHGMLRKNSGDAVKFEAGRPAQAAAGARSIASNQSLRHLLLHSQLDRLCRRRGQSERAVMMGGRGVLLAAESQVKKSEFFIALQGVDLPGKADTTISMACGLDKEMILSVLKDEIRVEEDIWFDEEKERFFARRGRFIGDLPIDEPSLAPANPEAIAEKLVNILVERWDWLIAKHEGLGGWMSRLNFWAQHDSEAKLNDELIRQFIEMAAFNKTSIKEVLEGDLVALLESLLDKNFVREFNAQIPLHFTAVTGFKHKIDYSAKHAAYVDVRLQELFGLNVHPKIAGGKIPITFRLLGPNYRPVQVTSDILSFWNNAYKEVRKELRARYPKHSWPEDPLTAQAEAKGRRRQ